MAAYPINRVRGIPIPNTAKGSRTEPDAPQRETYTAAGTDELESIFMDSPQLIGLARLARLRSK